MVVADYLSSLGTAGIIATEVSMNDRVLGAPPTGPIEAPAPSQGQRVGADAGAPAIVGTWELLAFVSRDIASGEVAYTLGNNQQKILIYDKRRIAVQ